MSRRKQVTEADVVRIIMRDGVFRINPLMWRYKGRVKLLDLMCRNGILWKRTLKLDRVEYFLKEARDGSR